MKLKYTCPYGWNLLALRVYGHDQFLFLLAKMDQRVFSMGLKILKPNVFQKILSIWLFSKNKKLLTRINVISIQIYLNQSAF